MCIGVDSSARSQAWLADSGAGRVSLGSATKVSTCCDSFSCRSLLHTIRDSFSPHHRVSLHFHGAGVFTLQSWDTSDTSVANQHCLGTYKKLREYEHHTAHSQGMKRGECEHTTTSSHHLTLCKSQQCARNESSTFLSFW